MVRADSEFFGASWLAGVWEAVVESVFLGDRDDKFYTRDLSWPVSRDLGIVFALIKVLNQQLYGLLLIFRQIDRASSCFL
jgi:hypothetical protein